MASSPCAVLSYRTATFNGGSAGLSSGLLSPKMEPDIFSIEGTTFASVLKKKSFGFSCIRSAIYIHRSGTLTSFETIPVNVESE